jgi:hypothetical protein
MVLVEGVDFVLSSLASFFLSRFVVDLFVEAVVPTAERESLVLLFFVILASEEEAAERGFVAVAVVLLPRLTTPRLFLARTGE